MRYVIVNHYATTPEYNGGTRHYDLANELLKKGHHVTIVASSFNHFEKKETKEYSYLPYKMEKIEGINFLWIKTKKYKGAFERIVNILSFYKNAKKALISYQNHLKPDYVIGSTVHPLAAQVALDFSKRSYAAFIFEERDLWPQTFVDFNKLSKKSIIAKVLYKYEEYFYKSAKKIIVLFPKAPSYIKSRGIDEEKILYLPNGFSETMQYAPIANNYLLKVLNNNHTITYTGSHGIANDLDKILDFAKVIESIDVKILLIGDGLEKKRLKARVEEEGIRNVLFFDSVAKNQVSSILSASTFTIISMKKSPLYKYGFSMNKIFDYLKAEKPMIMLADSNLANEYNIDGISLGEDLKLHLNFVEEQLANKKQYQNSINNIKEFSKEYNWRNLAKKFMEEMGGAQDD